MTTISPHGMTKARGCSHVRFGTFCKLIPDLPAWADDCGIKNQCEAEEIAALLGGPGGIMHDADGSSEDSGIPAGYTFFAQFIDHDITLDTTSKLHGEQLDNKDIANRPNLRTASLDLDCVYGLGPDANPFMYDQSQPGRMLIGNPENQNDVPRNRDGRAMIGDPRNDENLFVSQLQLMFLRLHNRRIVGRSFEDAQEDCRFHYQWLVLNDFLRRVCDPKLFAFAKSKLAAGKYPLCPPKDKCGRICMPVEFAVGAYRFGHTMVRSQYPVNTDHPVIELFDERFGTLGFSPLPTKLVVDWRFLLDVEKCHEYVKSKAIDHLIADELIHMPDPVVGRGAGANDRSLAFRNLLRSYVLGLPSGQRLAQGLVDKGYDKKLIDPNYPLAFDKIKGWHCLPKATREKLEKHTPLFLYILLEGTAKGGKHLGRVGSAVLMEVFSTMLVHCRSFLAVKGWQPDPCIWEESGRPDKTAEDFTLADIARYVKS